MVPVLSSVPVKNMLALPVIPREPALVNAFVPVLIVPAPAREKIAKLVAWSCRECGHILVDGESAESCPRCGDFPGHWITATVSDEPIDVGEPTVGEGAATGAGGRVGCPNAGTAIPSKASAASATRGARQNQSSKTCVPTYL